MVQLSESSLKKLLITLAVYLTSLFAANTLGLKLIPFIFGSHLSVAILSFPVVFLTTDIVGEVYGKNMARLFILAGFVATALFILYSAISLGLPWSNDALWVQKGYNQVFGISIRIAIASLAAFAIAEYQDIVSFFLLKDRWQGKYFWGRSMISNIWSQLLDTIIFNFIAFAGVYSWKILINITITWWVYKVLMGGLYSPLSYLGLRLLRGTNK